MNKLIGRNPIAVYFTLTFLMSWMGIILVSFFLGMPTTSTIFEEIGPYALIPFLLGPITIGLYATGAQYGKEGFSSLGKRLANWKIKPGWYLFSMLTVPVFIAVWLFVLNQFSVDFMPNIAYETDKISFVATGILTGLIGGGLLEEIGWTGFVTPLLRKRYSILKTGALLGFVWGLWHFLPVYWASGDVYGRIDWSSFLPGLFSHYAVLIPFRILIVWLHDRTISLIPVILFHSTLTTYALFILNITSSGLPGLIYYAGLAVFLWMLVGVLTYNGKLTEKSVPTAFQEKVLVNFE